MSITPQYTYDNQGNPVGVFLSLIEWNQITQELKLDIPDWQKKLIDLRLKEYYENPSIVEDVDDLIKLLDKEDKK